MNPRYFDDVVAGNKQALASLDLAIDNMRRIIESRPGTRPDCHLHLVSSKAPEHLEPEPAPLASVVAERLLDLLMAVGLGAGGALLGYAWGAGWFTVALW